MPYKLILLSCLMAATNTIARGQITIALTASPPSPQPVGTPVVWTATVTGATTPSYQFLAGTSAQLNLVRDHSSTNTLPWTELQEQSYQVKVKVFDLSTRAFATKAASYTFTSRISGGAPSVVATQHPLVALYSAPACSAGQVQVQFQPAGGATWQTTPPQNCNGNFSLNFYVAGMMPNTTYILQQLLINGGDTTPGPLLNFQTGSAPFAMPAATILTPPNISTSSEGVLITALEAKISVPASEQIGIIATDLFGNLLWYYPGMVGQPGGYMLRPAGPGGTMLVLLAKRIPAKFAVGQLLREIDLAGNLVRETSVSALNGQLTAKGKDKINWLSHEGLRLTNGHTLVLGTVERLLTNIQGSGSVDVLGDMIIDLDQNFQVSWTWNSFDFLDAHRTAILGETCDTTSPTCPPLYLATQANDWTHANSLTYLPDGNLAISLRNQDWVVKLQYQDGTGPGSILWHLGPGGDFTLTNGTGPFPWFSHQHDVNFNGVNYGLFDNGNTRVTQTGGGNSRGQIYAVDESGFTATLLLSADLQTYSDRWGSAQTLSNGDYQFMSGRNTSISPGLNESLEISPGGNTDYGISFPSWAYRSFRVTDLYTYRP